LRSLLGSIHAQSCSFTFPRQFPFRGSVGIFRGWFWLASRQVRRAFQFLGAGRLHSPLPAKDGGKRFNETIEDLQERVHAHPPDLSPGFLILKIPLAARS
jgi:hypothetical protein